MQGFQEKVRPGDVQEDRFTSALESQTAKMPSSSYLGFAIASMAASAMLKLMNKNDWSLFVGQWAPAFLIIGVYNKLVKQQGSDASYGGGISSRAA